ncbi:hypothetical protein SUDANB120_04784 [Streptomyces sp. enrichment culture]
MPRGLNRRRGWSVRGGGAAAGRGWCEVRAPAALFRGFCPRAPGPHSPAGLECAGRWCGGGSGVVRSARARGAVSGVLSPCPGASIAGGAGVCGAVVRRRVGGGAKCARPRRRFGGSAPVPPRLKRRRAWIAWRGAAVEAAVWFGGSAPAPWRLKCRRGWISCAERHLGLVGRFGGFAPCPGASTAAGLMCRRSDGWCCRKLRSSLFSPARRLSARGAERPGFGGCCPGVRLGGSVEPGRRLSAVGAQCRRGPGRSPRFREGAGWGRGPAQRWPRRRLRQPATPP